VGIHKVWVTLPDGEAHHAGDLAFGQMSTDGRCPSAFRYTADWLRRGFPLDPESLPLQSGEFHSSHLAPPLAVFSDALPDAWGQHIIDLTRGIPLQQRTPERYITEIGRCTLGALGFNHPTETIKQAPALSIADLVQAALDVDAGCATPSSELGRLFTHGASAGGARPKVLIAHDDADWILKLASPHKDRGYDVPLLEYVSMQITRECLPATPESRLMPIAGRNAVLIRRFDITEHGRNHQISLSALAAERVANYAGSYDDLARILAKHSVRPRDDLTLLFTQAVLNAAIGNTDDHLKNFMMQRGEGGYRLAPAFDIVPNIGRNIEHVIAFGNSRHAPSRATLIEMGNRWMGGAEGLEVILENVLAQVTTFRSRLGALNDDLPAHAVLLDEITSRCERIS
jgi:serine/threonine-protein kinase HipA